MATDAAGSVDLDAVRTALRTLDLQLRLLRHVAPPPPVSTERVREMAEELQRTRTELDAANRQREAALTDLASARALSERTTHDLDALRTSTRSHEALHVRAMESLRSEHTRTLEATRSEHARAMERLRARQADAEAQTKAARAAAERTVQESIDAARRISALELRIRTLEEERDTMRSELTRSEQRAAQLRARSDKLGSESAARERQIAELIAQLALATPPAHQHPHADEDGARACMCTRSSSAVKDQKHPNGSAPTGSAESGSASHSAPPSASCSLHALNFTHLRTLSNFYQREIIERFADNTVKAHTLENAHAVADSCLYDILFSTLLPRLTHDVEHRVLSHSTLMVMLSILAARELTFARVLLPSVHTIATHALERVNALALAATQCSEQIARYEVMISTLHQALSDTVSQRTSRDQLSAVLRAVEPHIRNMSVTEIRVRKETRAAAQQQNLTRVHASLHELEAVNLMRQLNVNAAIQIESMHIPHEREATRILHDAVAVLQVQLQARYEARAGTDSALRVEDALASERARRRRDNVARMRSKLSESSKRVEASRFKTSRDLQTSMTRVSHDVDRRTSSLDESASTLVTNFANDYVSMFHTTCSCAQAVQAAGAAGALTLPAPVLVVAGVGAGEVMTSVDVVSCTPVVDAVEVVEVDDLEAAAAEQSRVSP
jgi:hypothetical protein